MSKEKKHPGHLSKLRFWPKVLKTAESRTFVETEMPFPSFLRSVRFKISTCTLGLDSNRVSLFEKILSHKSPHGPFVLRSSAYTRLLAVEP